MNLLYVKISKMNVRNCFRAITSLLLITIIIFHTSGAFAQSDQPPEEGIFSYAGTSSPNLSEFPLISLYLAVHDGTGNFMRNFQRGDFLVVEDDVAISAVEAERLRPGLQVVTAITPGSPFARRNSQAVSRYDTLLDSLQSWYRSRGGTTIDDYSLMVQEGPQVIHNKDSLAVVSSLEEINREVREIEPNLDILFQAIEIAADPTPRDGMGKAVFWITPPLDQLYAQSLENAATRAFEQGVKIFVWSIGADDPSTNQANQRLEALAKKTGGTIFVSTTDEEFPSPEEFLDPLREVYDLRYVSAIQTSGVHTVRVEILNEGQIITTPTKTFEMMISSPVPAFVLPPGSIHKEIIQDDETQPQDEPQYQPESQVLEFLVDFPDGLRRPLTRSALLVDNVLVEEHSTPPFNKFTWDLSGYRTDGDHTIKVEVTDQFGLSGSSIDTIVTITLERPVSNWLRFLSSNLPTIILLVFIVAGALILLFLILGGKIQPGPMGRKKKTKATPQPAEPELEKEAPRTEASPAASLAKRLRLPQRKITRASAYLTPYEGDKPAVSESKVNRRRNTQKSLQFSIHTDEVTVGSDSTEVLFLIEDPSVDPLHSRLVRQADKSFLIFDEHTAAGTWVNYSQVDPDGHGQRLQHGDIIHFGRCGFSFTLH